jgi:hypothetical protein
MLFRVKRQYAIAAALDSVEQVLDTNPARWAASCRRDRYESEAVAGTSKQQCCDKVPFV